MDKRAGSIRVWAAMAAVFVLLLAFSCAALAEADPIRVSSRCEPQSVVTEQDVTVTIKIYNSGQTDMTQDITLHDPTGISVEKYLGGLKAEQSVTYTGTWHVTQDQIDEGRIKYYIQYYIETADGPQKVVNTIPVTIQAASATPQLTATYTVNPPAAREGQQVTLSYTLSNTGNVELRDISVVNEGVSDRELSAPSLSVGEKITLTDTFTMGEDEVVSHPTVTYRATDSDEEMTIGDMARRTITVSEDGLEATLELDPAENVYPGETVGVKLTLKNSGESAYSGLTATMPDGTVIAQGVDLAPGTSHEASAQWTPQQAGSVAAEITGTGSEGESVGVASNAVELTLQDEATALVLRVRAQAQDTTIYSEPAVVRFGIVVENIGQTDATTLTISEAGTTVATIPSLPSGESRTVVLDLITSIAGQIQFSVSGKDALGYERSYTSNVIPLVYMAPTPTPTLAPSPTPVPPTPSPVPTPTPRPSIGEVISEHVDLRVLYAVAGVLGAALVLIVATSTVSSVRRKKRMDGALDTIELTPDIRNHRGKKRPVRKDKGAKREKNARSKDAAPENGELPKQIVPTPELTEEDTMHSPASKPQAEQSAPQARETGRRRPVTNVDVPKDDTLRVAPVGERPEFVAQGKVDDSQTRVFPRVKRPEAVKAEGAKVETPKPEFAKAEPAQAETAQAEPVKSDAGHDEGAVSRSAQINRAPLTENLGGANQEDHAALADQTIRFNRSRLEQIKNEQKRRDTYDKGGKKREEIKPMKKKFSLFGKRKKDSEDDFMEEPVNDLDLSEEDDDFYD